MTVGMQLNLTMSRSDNSGIDHIAIAPRVSVWLTSRGIVTSSPYSGVNLCHYTGDDPDHVSRSRVWLAVKAGIAADRIIVPRQTHSTECRVIDRLPVAAADIEGVDALVTTMRGVGIGVSTADCVPVVMADAETGVIGVAHAGWRGAVAGIVPHTLDVMKSLGAVAGRIRALIGPCICAGCFEVGEEVAAQFPDPYIMRGTVWPHVDLPGYVRGQLMECGVNDADITMPDGCTRCNPDRYFSARASGIASGRNFTMVMLEP